MGGPIVRHARQLIYDDRATHIGAPLGFGDTNREQTAMEYVDARLDALEGLDASPLTGVVLTQSILPASGRMSDGIGGLNDNPNHFDTLNPGDVFANLVNAPLTFTLIIPGAVGVGAANAGHLGTVMAVLNGVQQTDTFDLAAAFNPLLADGAQVYPPATSVGGTITITSVQKFGASSVHQIWKGRINLNGTFDLPGVLAGENTLALRHINGAAIQTSNAVMFFNDTDITRPVVAAAPTIVEAVPGAFPRFVSGVRKYLTGDTFTISGGLLGAFDNTFHNTPLQLILVTAAMTNADIAYNDAGVVGPNVPPRVTDAFTYTGVHAIDTANVLSEDAMIAVRGRDPFGFGMAVNSISEHRMINTYSTVDDALTCGALFEEFRNEHRRLSHFTVQGNNASPVNQFNAIPGAITGVWTSTTVLANGEAILFDDGLDYPTQNFPVGFLPAQVGNDYSAFAGTQYYLRAMIDPLAPHQAGILKLANWVLATFNTAGIPTAKVELKLPTQTDWIDLGLPYNAAIFPIRPYGAFPADWAAGPFGCRTAPVLGDNPDEIRWTAGVFSTVNSGQMVILRISLLNVGVPTLTSLSEIGW
jgi:hypothetical protein